MLVQDCPKVKSVGSGVSTVCECCSSGGKCFPSASAIALKEKYPSQQAEAKQYHKITPHNKPHPRDREGKTRSILAIYTQERNSRELKGRQVLFRVSCGRSFSGWRFPLVRFQAKPRDFEFRNSWSFVLRNWWSFVLKYWGVCVPKDWWCFVLRNWWGFKPESRLGTFTIYRL